MGILTEWITEWLKGLLIEGIMGNLEGLFDTVNTRVGEISVQVGTTPAAWNAGVFSLIRQLSETVILPIAGLILTFVATYELIQMILEKNNMHEFDVANIYKWVFKTTCAILILSNTFNIVMAVFDVSQSVIASAAGIVTGATDITPDMLAEPVEFFSVDVSFISLHHIFPVAQAITTPDAMGVCLVKPQFEAGREKVGKNGVVRDPATHREVLHNAMGYAAANGFKVCGLDFSPVKGPEGNIEYLMFVQKSDEPGVLDDSVAEQVVASSHSTLDR